MKIFQAYYTSCKVGITGSSGFQFYSISDGILEEEKREMMVYGKYSAPHTLPSQPTLDQIKNEFPISYSYFRLSTGRVGINKSVYLGKDYSGRFGNYFSHTLIADGKNFPCHPILLMNDKNFKTGLSIAEEQIKDRPTPLPNLDFDDLIISNEHLDIYHDPFFQNSINQNNLEKLFNALMSFEKEKRRIVPADSSSNIMKWIAALTLIFPSELASNITFTTYTHDPGSCNTMIAATVNEGVKINFQNALIRDFQFYIFDFLSDIQSNVKEKLNFSKAIAQLEMSDNQQAFQKFLFAFQFSFPSLLVEDVFTLFQFLEGQGQAQLTLSKATRFASDFASIEILERLARDFDKRIDLEDFDKPSDIYFLIEFLFKTSSKTNNSSFFESGFSFLMSTWDYFIFSKENYQSFYQPLFDLSKKLFLLTQELQLDFRRSFFENNNIDFCQSTVDDSNSLERIGVFLALFLKFGKVLNNDFFKNNQVRELVKSCYLKMQSSELVVKDTLLKISDLPQLFTEQLIFANDVFSNNKVLTKIFREIVEQKPKEWKDEVAINFKKNQQVKWLNELFLVDLQFAKNKKDSFWNFIENNLTNIKLNAIDFISIFSYYIPKVNYNTKEFNRLVQLAKKLNQSVIFQEVILVFERDTLLTEPSSKEENLIEYFHERKEEYKIITPKQIVELLFIGIGLQSNSSKRLLPVLKQLEQNIKQLSESQAEQFFDWIMYDLLFLIKNKEDHISLLRFLDSCGISSQNLITIYFQNVMKMVKQGEGEKKFFRTVLEFYSDIEKADLPPSLKKKRDMGVLIGNGLIKMQPKQISQLTKTLRLSLSRSELKEVVLDDWERILVRVRKLKSRTPTKRIFNFIKSVLFRK